MRMIVPRPGESAVEVLQRCDGWYICPRDASGRRLGPMVGYAGKDDQDLHYIGDVYANFAQAEQHPAVLTHFARQIIDGCGGPLVDVFSRSDGFCGVPEGGKSLAVALSFCSGKGYIYPEKKVTIPSANGQREVSELVFGRHEPLPGELWWIVEDVCNNFSTTAKLIALIESYHARVAGIMCFLNRSLSVGKEYSPQEGMFFPVVAAIHLPIVEYRQDDPSVRVEVLSGNVVWKPKHEWQKLTSYINRKE